MTPSYAYRMMTSGVRPVPPMGRTRAPESVVHSSILGLVDPALEVTNDVSVRRPNAVHGPLVGLPVRVS